MTDLYPMLIAPRYDERIWGGYGLADRLGKAAPRDRKIGESWEIYDQNAVANGAYAGRTIAALREELGRDLTGGHVAPGDAFPVLTKLIDARDVLSVQVHPDDALAQKLEGQPNGKTECWYVIDAAPGATLTYGFTRDTNPDEYARLVAEGRLDAILRQVPVRPGDVVYLPAGMVHAIGAGIILYEVQQTSDVTYRIYDWNRLDDSGHPRELHVEKARQVLDYHRNERGPVRTLSQPNSGRTVLVAGRYFCNELVEAGRAGWIDTYDSPVAVCALDHPLQVTAGANGPTVTLAAYSSLLIPAAAGSYELAPAESGAPARAIVTYVPTSPGAVRVDLRSRGFADGEIDGFLAQFAPLSDLGRPAAP
jgi:mannose-6-phosphate isomerase